MPLRLCRTHAAVLTAAALIAVLSTPVWSQQAVPSPTAPGSAASDPPGRVARLNYFTGNVTMEPAGETEWAYAQLNRPLTMGDQIWADNGARAELHVGSTALRLDQQTALSMVDIDDTTLQLKLTQGSLSSRVRAWAPGQTIEIDTPNVALQASSAGEFRVDVAPDGNSTTVTLRSGNAMVYGDGGSLQMTAGQQIRFTGVNLQQQAGGPAPGLDAFDQWIVSRDRLEDASVSARYVSREIPGYEDLDANGTWRSDPSYGEVWVPTVAVSANWAPYREGHWTWIAPWGWTWVDDAPWGFAPFHYGRWAYLGNAWAWVPGPVVAARPVYAPALVAFVGGGGSHWGVDLAIGGAVGAGVAWFALGPHEPWHPGSGYSPSYYNRVNNYVNVHNTTIVNNITNVHNTYINQRVPGAVIAVPANTFVHGQPVAQAAHGLTAEQIGRAQVGAGTPGIAPVRGSFTGGMRTAPDGVPHQVAQRQVVATRAPAVPAAYRDTLAQRFASGGARVQGAGEPIVRTTVPAAFTRPINRNVGAAPEGYRLVSRSPSHPVATPQNAPGRNEPANLPREESHGSQSGQRVQPGAPLAAQDTARRPFIGNAANSPAPHAPRPEQQNEAPAAGQPQAHAPNEPAPHALNEPRPEPRHEPQLEHEPQHPHPAQQPAAHEDRPHPVQPAQHAESRPQPARPPEHEQHQEHQEHHEEHAK
ncbi:DUF6600 domain-containing protein [Caballeronia sp. dw_276]|uniref:DUF6600 domain-containing protein n=1 Tax=Caballeronia sp. dw_276 TaxID=2719795 RepID=UPI001BD4F0E4|nr:DUF6600 domain-containing protein [Caballeronia sp. dw_276]